MAEKDGQKSQGNIEPDKASSIPHGVIESAIPKPALQAPSEEKPPNIVEQGDVQLETPPPLYTIFSHREKAGIIILVSFLAIISPLSSSIYFPALTSIADDLNVSISLVNLTITTYLVSLKPTIN
jgi:hypothetical protein